MPPPQANLENSAFMVSKILWADQHGPELFRHTPQLFDKVSYISWNALTRSALYVDKYTKGIVS